MVKEAEVHADEDAERREEIEVRNHADSAHYQAEKMLREQGDKMPEQVRIQVAEKSSAVKRALDANDVDAHEDRARGAAAGDDGRRPGGLRRRRAVRAEEPGSNGQDGGPGSARGHRRRRIPRSLTAPNRVR